MASDSESGSAIVCRTSSPVTGVVTAEVPALAGTARISVSATKPPLTSSSSAGVFGALTASAAVAARVTVRSTVDASAPAAICTVALELIVRRPPSSTVSGTVTVSCAAASTAPSANPAPSSAIPFSALQPPRVRIAPMPIWTISPCDLACPPGTRVGRPRRVGRFAERTWRVTHGYRASPAQAPKKLYRAGLQSTRVPDGRAHAVLETAGLPAGTSKKRGASPEAPTPNREPSTARAKEKRPLPPRGRLGEGGKGEQRNAAAERYRRRYRR